MSGNNPQSKSFEQPDEVLRFDRITVELVELGDLVVGRYVQQPGWRWSEHVRPKVGGDWCKARHVGVTVSGSFGVVMENGTKIEFGPGDVYEIPPGHDGYTIGDEPCVNVEWSGIRTFSGFRTGASNRSLLTLLFTDLVDSTLMAGDLGDQAWRDELSRHYESMRLELDRFGGREVKTTGDGMLSVFDSPVHAIRCAVGIRGVTRRQNLDVRSGVHVGEVEILRDDLHGIAVHEAARIMSTAGPGEILVSEITRTLVGSGDLTFEDRGVYVLKGLEGERRLFAYVETAT